MYPEEEMRVIAKSTLMLSISEVAQMLGIPISEVVTAAKLKAGLHVDSALTGKYLQSVCDAYPDKAVESGLAEPVTDDGEEEVPDLAIPPEERTTPRVLTEEIFDEGGEPLLSDVPPTIVEDMGEAHEQALEENSRANGGGSGGGG